MITASIVIFNTPLFQLDAIVKSITVADCVKKIYVIDNSASVESENYFKHCAINNIVDYIPHKNTGYGSSHNIALHKAIEYGSDYHVILNPDIYFDSNVLFELIQFMDNNPDIAYVLPKVVYPNGELQYLCKLLPTPFDLIIRRFLPRTNFITRLNDRYELRQSGYDKIMNPPCLSGCFMFLRLTTLKDNNLYFDDRYFMYCEDFDLIRRIHRVSRTVYYPYVTIVHNHEKASYKSKKMLMIHIKSAIKYFNKFGWFFDKERRLMNNQILEEIEDFTK